MKYTLYLAYFSITLIAAFPSQKVASAPILKSTKKIRVCVGDEYWYPYSIVEKGKATGVHVDLATMAIKAAGFDVDFVPMNWTKCVEIASQSGAMDIPLSAEWRPARGEWLHYPDGAIADGPKCKSKASLGCVGNILVVSAGSDFQYAGDKSKVPQPIRIVEGLGEIRDFKAAGVNIETGPDEQTNLQRLIAAGKGSVLMLAHSASAFTAKPEFKNKFQVVSGYNDASDAFMPVSKKGQLTRDEAKRIWDEMAKLRKYPVVLDNALKRYPPKQTPASGAASR